MSSPSVTHTSRNKKTLSFSVRAEKDLYESFRESTYSRGTNTSAVIRQFMIHYTRNELNNDFDEKDFDVLFQKPQVQNETKKLFSALRNV
jgi:hypothetical protein